METRKRILLQDILKLLLLPLLIGCVLGICFGVFLYSPHNVVYRLVTIFLIIILFSNLLAKLTLTFIEIAR